MAVGKHAIAEPVLRAKVDTRREGDLEALVRQVAGWFDHAPTEAQIFFAPEVANVIRCTIQVTDRRRRVIVGPAIVHLWISDLASGVPGGTQTVAFVTGTLLDTFDPNVRFNALTDANGLIEIDITVTGAGTRDVYAQVLPPVQSARGTWV